MPGRPDGSRNHSYSVFEYYEVLLRFTHTTEKKFWLLFKLKKLAFLLLQKRQKSVYSSRQSIRNKTAVLQIWLLKLEFLKSWKIVDSQDKTRQILFSRSVTIQWQPLKLIRIATGKLRSDLAVIKSSNHPKCQENLLI